MLQCRKRLFCILRRQDHGRVSMGRWQVLDTDVINHFDGGTNFCGLPPAGTVESSLRLHSR